MKRTFILLLLATSAMIAPAQDTTRLSLLFFGDIMQHDSQIADAYEKSKGAYDYMPCFKSVKPYIEAVDLAIGNLEVTLAGRPYKGYPQFSAPDELLIALKDIGVDVLVTANNHCVDRGLPGLERTIAMLDSSNIPHTGTFRNRREKEKLHPLIIERLGFRLALLNYTYGTNGLPVTKPNIVNMIDTAAIRKDLEVASKLGPDAIIVFTHWGAEYQSLPSRSQKELTELCFRYGARLVIGAHPHVLQPMEWRKKDDQLVAYSLGNFVSGQRKRYTDGGAMLRVELEKVTFSDKASHTSIDTAGYILEWVYRTADAEKNYFILPVPTVEEEPGKFINDAASLDAFRTFVADSRALFRTHNKQIVELRSAPEFHLRFNATDTLAVRKYLQDHSGIQRINRGRYPLIEVGPFTLPDAMHMQQRIRLNLPVEELQIRRE